MSNKPKKLGNKPKDFTAQIFKILSREPSKSFNYKQILMIDSFRCDTLRSLFSPRNQNKYSLTAVEVSVYPLTYMHHMNV